MSMPNTNMPRTHNTLHTKQAAHVVYMAGNQHEITNMRVTNMRHYAGWLFQITNMRQLRMLVTSNNQHAKGPQVGLRMLVILFQIPNLWRHHIFKIQPAHVD